jgi:hypothetical protein
MKNGILKIVGSQGRGKGERNDQTLYAHMNKRNFKKR